MFRLALTGKILAALTCVALLCACGNPSVIAVARGRVFEGEKKYQKAIEEYNSALHFEPDNQVALYHRGLCYQELEKFDSAIKDFSVVLKHNDKDTDAYFNRGWCLANTNKLDEAIKDFSKAIEQNDHYDNAYFQRGWCYYTKKDYGAAIKDYSAAISLRKWESYFYYRGIAYRLLQQYEKMHSDMNNAVTYDPHNPHAYFMRAWADYYTGRLAQVPDDMRKAIELDHWRPDTAIYGVIMSNLANNDMQEKGEALDILSQGQAKIEKKIWPYAVVEYLSGKKTEAETLKVAKDNDELTEAHAYIGMDLLIHGKLKQAVPHMKWVKERGNKEFLEYDLVLSQAGRLKEKI